MTIDPMTIDPKTADPKTADLVHVVDDDPAMRDSLAFLLDTAGYAVRLYATGLELLDRLARFAAPVSGCVLTDIRMPGIDGLTLLRRLREAGNRLPVIVMTGHGDVPLAVEAMKRGARDFIEKPFDDEVLLRPCAPPWLPIRRPPAPTRRCRTSCGGSRRSASASARSSTAWSPARPARRSAAPSPSARAPSRSTGPS